MKTPPKIKMTRIPALSGLPFALPKGTTSDTAAPKPALSPEGDHASDSSGQQHGSGDEEMSNSNSSATFANLGRDVYQFGERYGVANHMLDGSSTPLFSARSEYPEPSSPLRQNFNNLRVNSPALQQPHFHM
jgi:hypothetical protein